MNTNDFESVVNAQLKRCTDVLIEKAKEYATNDRLHNFKVAAGIQGITPRQALAGMMAKHTVSVYDMCRHPGLFPIELWNEKITDSINYLLLLRAMVEEEYASCLSREGTRDIVKEAHKAMMERNFEDHMNSAALPKWEEK